MNSCPELSPEEIERLNQMSREKNQLDLQSEFVYARREGVAKGRQEGKQEGEVIGVEKTLDLIAKGYSPEDIRKEILGR